MCVQRFDDSLNSAIHITYRISLRSSSMREPRDPLLKVLTCFKDCGRWPTQTTNWFKGLLLGPSPDTSTQDPNQGVGLAAVATDLGKQHGSVHMDVFAWGPDWTSQIFVMILPQVHLRKPCYDFYFL